MDWITVESSAVSALGYEAGRRRLGIEFRESRVVYFYSAVPRWEFEDFLKAESKGRYLTQVFSPSIIPFQDPTRAAGGLPEACSEIAQQQFEAAQMHEAEEVFDVVFP